MITKQDPRFNVEKSFERVYNELDLKREKLKKQIDDYYSKLRNNIEDKKILKNMISLGVSYDGSISKSTKTVTNRKGIPI